MQRSLSVSIVTANPMFCCYQIASDFGEVEQDSVLLFRCESLHRYVLHDYKVLELEFDQHSRPKWINARPALHLRTDQNTQPQYTVSFMEGRDGIEYNNVLDARCSCQRWHAFPSTRYSEKFPEGLNPNMEICRERGGKAKGKPKASILHNQNGLSSRVCTSQAGTRLWAPYIMHM